MPAHIMLLLSFGYMLLALLNYSGTFAYFQRKYPELAKEMYWQDLSFALVIGLLGPMGLLISAPMSRFYRFGFKFY